MSVTALVLLDVEPAQVNDIGTTAANIEGVHEVYSVASSEADLVVVMRVADHEAIARVVTEEISSIPGIISTRTMIAFRTYSESSLDAAFEMFED